MTADHPSAPDRRCRAVNCDANSKCRFFFFDLRLAGYKCGGGIDVCGQRASNS